jgi:hypothetical protein
MPKRTTSPGITIGDDEIRARYGADADAIIAELDKDKATKTYDAFYHGKRNRNEVEKWLAANRKPAP